ncbi:Serine/threonine protein phosphatase PrpC [Marinobacter mobilis]|uniref:Serine/threonine protein phosphatase PrpC n=1 Tax=Marinobacter mobilis TaxID=488533 RepID=A0A1H3ASA6_9GAMM|nr:Serine/threonine protein phosphatase PrpC [Marinobacter mobilis]
MAVTAPDAPSPNQSLPLPCASAQVTGQRQRQEDTLRLTRFDGGPAGPGLLAVICDGMGGHVHGDMASALVAERFVASFLAMDGSAPDRLRGALSASHDALIEATTRDPQLDGMGTTLVAACIVGDQLYRISVGDSQLWRLRDHQMERLNDDHSMAPVFDSMVEMGELTPVAAREDGKRHALRSAITRKPIHKIDGPATPDRLLPGDCLLVASDGLDSLDRDSLLGILDDDTESPQHTLDRLFTHLGELNAPQQDNTSVILISMPATTSAADSVRVDTPANAPAVNAPGTGFPTVNSVLAGALALVLILVFLWILL